MSRPLALRLANGARIPSTAEEVLAETHRLFLRCCGSRRYGFVDESGLPMSALYLPTGTAR